MALIKLIFSCFAQAITSLFFIGIVMVAYLYIQRNARLEESWLGVLRNPVSTQLADVVLYGMLVGLMASVLIVLIGIAIDYNAILFIWPLALFLMLFNQRYICFSYAGGIVSLVSLLTGWPKVDVSSLIALVGILHLMESLLIILDGYKDSLPVWIEHRMFKPVGAYLMQKVWPIPLVVLVIPEAGASLASGGGVAMPDWWPLFKPQNMAQVFALLPIVAVLGYGDIAITQLPNERTRESGFWLGVYSTAILIMAVVSSRVYWVKYVAAVSAPLFHELLIILSKRGQMRGKPAFAVPWRGLRVLEVLPESPAQKMGVQRGDILLRLNGRDINSEDMLHEVLSQCMYFIWVEVRRKDKVLTLEYQDYQNPIEDLGIIFVPRTTGRYFRVDEQKGIIFRLWKRIRHSMKEAQSQ